jgi:hypothetical protein
MKPSTWRRISAALLVAAFAFTFMVATGGASRVKHNPLERATRIVTKKHCAMYRSKRGKKRHHHRTCRSYKRGLTPLVPPARTSGLGAGAPVAGDTGSSGASGTSGEWTCSLRWEDPGAAECWLKPPCNALPYPQQDATGATGPWGVTGPDGPNVRYWFAGNTYFIGAPWCALDATTEWQDMPAEPSELLGDAGTRSSGAPYLGPGLVRLAARVVNPGASGAELRVQYSIDRSSWTYLDGVALSIATPGIKVSDWVDTPPAMSQGTVYVRVIGSGGDGVADPSFSGVAFQSWIPVYGP